MAEFCKHYSVPFRDLGLLKLALTHRSYLSVTGQGPRESNERLEFLGDSVLGLITSEFLYRRHPDEHEGQLTKTKSLLVSKAILSRRALRMGLGRFVLMSHSEVESGGRQRLSILADAFESVLGAIYLDQGFEAARTFITQHLLSESDAISSDKRHTNYKSHLQEYVQNSFRTHPVYRIRSEYGPDHSKHFMVEVMVGKRTLGEGRGHNKKEAEQAAARDALEKVEKVRRQVREDVDHDHDAPELAERASERDREEEPERDSKRGRDRGRERTREPRAERGARPEPGGRGRGEFVAAVPAARPEPTARDDEDDDEASDDSPGGRRRRRSRRGGRSRHAGERDTESLRPVSEGNGGDAGRDEDTDREPSRREEERFTPRLEPVRHLPKAGEDDDEDDDERDDVRAVPTMADDDDLRPPSDSDVRSRARGSVSEPLELEPLSTDAFSPGASVGRPDPEPAEVEIAPVPRRPTAVVPPSSPAPVSYGRGKRRGPASGPVAPPAAKPVAAPGPPPDEATVAHRAEVFESEEDALPPVVDVPPAEPDDAVESEAERDARIEEMERALDNFGRRRSVEPGRRRRR